MLLLNVFVSWFSVSLLGAVHWTLFWVLLTELSWFEQDDDVIPGHDLVISRHQYLLDFFSHQLWQNVIKENQLCHAAGSGVQHLPDQLHRGIADVCFELHFRVTPGQSRSAAVGLDCYTVSFTATWPGSAKIYSAAIRDRERSSCG